MNFENIKKEFPVTNEIIFFDHARVAPLPERVRQVVRRLSMKQPNSELSTTIPGCRRWNLLVKNLLN